ncbi:MAG TPA: hypothetical protein VG456_09255, partial [Candidatus Sulfopaludibacter sp.]|nr:hypothetical protein [Candidatus Sulfopaludibacter sp.]
MAAGCAGAMNGQQVILTFTPAGGTAINVTATITVTGPTLLTSDHNSGLTLNCNTTTGATPATIGIRILAGASVSVTPSFTNGAPLLAAPSPATVSSSVSYTSFSFSVAAGCANAVNGQTVTLTFTPATGTPLNITATLNVGGPTLVLSQASIGLTCDMFAGPGAAQSVGVTLKVAGASQMVSITASPNGILSLPAGQSVASTTVPSTFAFNVVSGCGGATNNQQITITFTPAVGNPITATATISLSTPTLASAQYAGLNLPCDTLLGPTPVTIGLTTYAATGSYVVSAVSASPSTVVVSAVGSTTVGSNTNATNWTVHAAAGCKSVVNNVPVAITFTPTGNGLQPLVINVTPVVTTTNGSALALSPSAVTIQCTKVGTTYSNITSSTVYVTSPANYGTPFSVDSTQGNAPPAYLSATTTPGSGAIASSTAIPLLITTNGTCGGLPIGNTVVHVNLANAPAADKVLTVTVQVGGPAPLTAPAVALAYVKGSATYTSQSTTITGPANTFYTVDQSSLPLWLNATTASGNLSGAGTATLTFKPTAGAETLAPGTYSASVSLKVAFALDSPVTVTLQVKSSPASLVIVEKQTQNLSWVLGAGTLPSLSITPISTSDAPIPYT